MAEKTEKDPKPEAKKSPWLLAREGRIERAVPATDRVERRG